MRSARSIAAPAAAKMISAVVLELTRCEACEDDLLDSSDPLEGWAGGEGFLPGGTGAPRDLGGAGGGEGSLELDGAGEDELEVDGDEPGDGGWAADGGGLLLEGGGGAAEEELDDMTARDLSYVFLQRNETQDSRSRRVVLSARSGGAATTTAGRLVASVASLRPSHRRRKMAEQRQDRTLDLFPAVAVARPCHALPCFFCCGGGPRGLSFGGLLPLPCSSAPDLCGWLVFASSAARP